MNLLLNEDTIMRYNKYYLSFLLAIILSHAAAGQKVITVEELRNAPTVAIVDGMYQRYPITIDTLNKFEDFIIIKGKLVDSTVATFGCGIYCTGGTLKIKLTHRNKKYKHKYAYLVMVCMTQVPEELKLKTEWQLKKIPLSANSCTLKVRNNFDTKGLPFYQLAGFWK